jgi:hypothetical protein
MQVPRGIRQEDGSFARSYAFKSLTGAVEAEAAEAVAAPSRPEAITNVLAVTLAHFGGNPVDRNVVQSLPFGDARVMMANLSRHLGARQQWMTSTCSSCKSPFDFAISPPDLPAPQELAVEQDWLEVTTAGGPVLVRAPLCSDQAAIAGHQDPERALLERCVARVRTEEDIHLEFGESDLAAIDAAMIALSPSLPFGAAVSCPSCGNVNELPVCTSDWLSELDDGPLQDVHDIASEYGWGEGDILALSRQRRKAYLRLIDEGRGMMSGRA